MDERQNVSTSDSTVQQWMLGLSRSNGAPGGGAASGVMLAIAAGLTSMVAGYSRPPDASPPTPVAPAEPASPAEPEPAETGPADATHETGPDAHHAAAGIDAIIGRAHALRDAALDLADVDAAASRDFGKAFALPAGPERAAAIRSGSIGAARSSAGLGGRAVEAIADLEWLAEHGNRALVADIAVALAALRAAISGARTNLSFDLAELRTSHVALDDVRLEHPALWARVAGFDEALARIDRTTAQIDSRAAPTDSTAARTDSQTAPAAPPSP